MTDTRPEYSPEQVEAAPQGAYQLAQQIASDLGMYGLTLHPSRDAGKIYDAFCALRSRLESAERDGFNSGVLAALAVLSDSGRAITSEYEEVVGSCGPFSDLLAAAKCLSVLDTSGIALYAHRESHSPTPTQGGTNEK